jgi:hypothetical protein
LLVVAQAHLLGVAVVLMDLLVELDLTKVMVKVVLDVDRAAAEGFTAGATAE